ncbi:MAG: CPBP family intramembrane metalloprotease [Bacilli bacterium]|nr:CPBP family intramembrane metalloprotease [Bacilli bacterium]
MQSILKYIKNILKVLIWPIIFIIGQFLLVIIFGVIFNAIKFNDIKLANDGLKNDELTLTFNEFIKTEEYQIELQNYISNNALSITIITFIVFGFILYKVYCNYKKEYDRKICFKDICMFIILGVAMNLSYNLIIGSLNNLFSFGDNYFIINIDILTYIICTGVLGPILEELLFRGIVFNRLKKFSKQMKSILLASFIFALFHANPIQMLYAFCLSFILIYVYEKYKNIKAPIIVHIASNTINFFACMLVNNNNLLLNSLLMVVSFIILFMINKIIFKKDLL